MKAYEITFGNGRKMTVKVEGIESRLQAYNLIHQTNLAADKGGVAQIRELQRKGVRECRND